MSAPTSAGPAASPRRTRRSQVRRDLQGFRGIGIILVVIGHLFRWPQGVYATLDIFFVISGFLITGILIDMHARYGRIYFTPFYLARFRRLAPMAFLVIGVTVTMTYALFSPARGDQVRTDGIWALLFGVNWHFAGNGTNYFNDSSESPLLHYWSLSIEEQFYAVWPLLLLLVLLLAARRSWSNGRAVAVTLGAVTAASFAYSLWHSVAAPNQAYFSTFDRVWEFGVGGLVAVAQPQLRRVPVRWGMALSWLGALGLFVPVFFLPFGAAFPAPWALPSVLCTAAIAAGGFERSTRHLRWVDNAPMVYVGDISYSVYLWHLPVNVLLKPYFVDGSPWYFAFAIGLTALLSVVSFHLIERPLRRARWLMTKHERRRLRRRPQQSRGLKVAWATLGTATALFLCAFAVVMPHAAPPTYSADPTTVAAPKAVASSDLVAEQQRRIKVALDRTTFPELTPGLSQLGYLKWADDQRRYGCYDVDKADLDRCSFGPAKSRRVAVVVGDSVGVSWMPGIRDALVPRGYTVQQLTLGQCATWTLPSYVFIDNTPNPECAEHHRLVREVVKRTKPDLVVLASSAIQTMNARRGGLEHDPVELARTGLLKTVTDLAPSGARILTLAPPPILPNLQTCLAKFANPDACERRPNLSRDQHVTGERSAAESGKVRFVETEDWFCADSVCPGFVGTTPVMSDGTHMTIQYSRELAPLLRQALLTE